MILPCYRGKRWLSEAIDSVRAQTHRSWRLTVVDDASPDNTAAYAEQHLREELAGPDRRASLIVLETRIGAAAARMEAIRRTNGEYIAFIDQDDRWRPEKLERQLERLEVGTPGLHAAHTDVVHIGEDGCAIRGSADRENAVRWRISYDRLDPQALQRCLFLRNSIRLASVLVSRSAFERAGGFDETLFGGEDWEFWVRFAGSGHRIGHIAAPLLERRLHAGNTSWRHGLERSRGQWRALGKVLEATPELAELARKRGARILREEIGHGLGDRPGPWLRRKAQRLVRLAPTHPSAYAILLLAWTPPLRRAVLGRRRRRRRLHSD